jgi:LuxR family maltose regulon positive regulatory protein
VNIPLLTTKFYIPPLRAGLVPRPRLIERMTAGFNGKLTLISAPAGYGKTTLLSSWIARVDRPAAWLSLDEDDNDIARFLDYLIAAFQTIMPEFGGTIPTLQSRSGPPPVNILLASLINEVSNIPKDILLVLDDYHVIKTEGVHQVVIFMLDNLPPNLHIAVASRTDPPLRVARLRARGDLCEIRAKDIRFTRAEAAEFLNRSMGLGLYPADVKTLTDVTEGWIAGLQLAAISLQAHHDKRAFVRAFAGHDRYIADYLLDEAIHRQPEHVQTFLLQTSILDRLSAPLCDAITGRNDSRRILTELERANLFLVSLDTQRNWYRYHHLFADLLRSRFHHTQADAVLDLHKKASIWYQSNGLYPDALNHALAANKVDRIVELTEEMAVYKMDFGELNALLAWLDSVPGTTVRRYPWLLVARAWALFSTGNYEAVEANLDEIENIQIEEISSNELSTRIQGHVAAIRSYLAELREDAFPAIQQAEDALGLLPDKDIQLRSFVAIRWANCLVWLGDFDKAIPAYLEAGEASKRVGDGQLAITALSEMAVVQMITGGLRQAVESITDVHNYAEMLVQRGGRRLPAMGILYRHMSLIKREQNELSEASYYAEEAVKICQQWGEKEALVFGLLSLARVQFALGEEGKVDETFHQIMQIAAQISHQAVEQFQNWALHYQLLRGKTENAEIWLQDHGLAVDDEFGYDRHLDYQNFARLLYAKGDYAQALEAVNALLKVTTEVGAAMYTIRYGVLQAILLHKLKKTGEAVIAMGRALSLAHAEGYVRSILDEGEPVAQLLYQAAEVGVHPEYCQRLLDEFLKHTPLTVSAFEGPGDLVEPLSVREIEVLQYISQGLTNQEIAQELILSLYTVKSHARNIYSKLGVKNRTEAVARARLLGLLPQD